jgi:hypothetical protein
VQAGPNPPKPPPARPGPPPRGGPGGRDRGGRKGAPSRPPPARPTGEATRREPPRPIEVPFRALAAAQEQWVVREGGQSLSGEGSGSRAALILLVFARAAEPERTLREQLVAARRLQDLSDDELLDALARSRPFREEGARREVFPDTRKRGSKGI